METIKMTTGAYFKSLKVVHLALALGVVFFTLTSILLQFAGFGTPGPDVDKILVLVVPIFALIGSYASNFIFRKKLNEIRKKSSLKEKMEEYRSALIIRLALIEGPSFLTVVAYLLTGNYLFLGLVVALLIVFFIYAPKQSKFIADLELTKTEADLINNPETEIV